MTIVVLPLNAAPGARASLARQYSNFASEVARGAVGETEIQAANLLARFEDRGVLRFALVNPSEGLNEAQVIEQFFGQSKADRIIDGLLAEGEGEATMTLRVWSADSATPVEHSIDVSTGKELAGLRKFVSIIVEEAGGSLPESMSEDEGLFGTANAEAFIGFLQGFDAVQYIEKAQGSVAAEFSPETAMNSLAEAASIDADWEAPYLALLRLSRLATQFRLGNAAMIQGALKKAIEIAPDDARGYFTLAELEQAIGRPLEAANLFEKAHTLDPEAPEILSRLGLAQLAAGMPVNAERNFRRAVEMEGPEKPSLDLLANVLTQTGRSHEVPALWKSQIEAHPQNPNIRAKFAISLMQAGKEDEAVQAFEEGLTALEDPIVVKRFYAPVLANKGDLDRAMDYYEDCLEVAPQEIPVLIEYAQTLAKASREFEVPPILRRVLEANPDPNTRAQASAWLVELEQPKRVEAVQNASRRAEEGDAKGAIEELKPLRNWLADYWKLWMVLAVAHNKTKQFEEAEQAARRVLEIFPGFEPGYAELNTALHGQAKHEDAYGLMAVAQQNFPQSVGMAVQLALAAKRSGREDEAKSLAKQLREAVGKNDDLERALAEIGY